MNIGDKMPDLLGKDSNGNDVRLSSFTAGNKFIKNFHRREVW